MCKKIHYYISKSNTYATIIYVMRNIPIIGSVIGLRIFNQKTI